MTPVFAIVILAFAFGVVNGQDDGKDEMIAQMMAMKKLGEEIQAKFCEQMPSGEQFAALKECFEANKPEEDPNNPCLFKMCIKEVIGDAANDEFTPEFHQAFCNADTQSNVRSYRLS